MVRRRSSPINAKSEEISYFLIALTIKSSSLFSFSFSDVVSYSNERKEVYFFTQRLRETVKLYRFIF